MRSAPWHVKGVAPAARETAQEAARRSGLSVGEWLNSAILGNAPPLRSDGRRPAANEPRKGEPRRAEPRGERDLPALNDRLDALTGQIDRLIAAAARNSGDEALPHQLAAAIGRFDQRLDQLIRDGRQANGEIERRVDSVDRALASLNQERSRAACADTTSDSVERAVAEIAARQRLLERDPAIPTALTGPAAYAPPPRAAAPPPADLSGLERQLRQITTQIESLNRPCKVDDAVAGLRRDLAEIGEKLSEAMPRRAIEALQGEVRKLAAQIEQGRGTGFDPAASAGLERALGDIHQSLRALTPAESLIGFEEAVRTLSRKVDLLGATGQDPAAVGQLEGAIEGLRGLVAHVASGEALAALAADVRALGDKVDRAATRPADNVLMTLERRMGEIAIAIEELRHDDRRSSVPVGFEALMQTLTDKIESLQLSRTDHLAIGNLEERITRLVEKLDASEARLGHLGAIERGMAELLVHLEEMRASPSGALRQPTADFVPPPSPSAPPVEVLSRDVAEIKQSQTVTGRRTEDSLEAVQGTIGDVVNRLAMIESDLRTDTRTPPPPPGDREPRPEPRVESPPAEAAPASPPRAALAPESSIAAPAPAIETPVEPTAPPLRPKQAAQARQPIDPSLPPDFPLEPGSGAPRPRHGASSADRIAASEAPLRTSRAAPAAEGEEAEPTNFLQAARRAAKAAAAQQVAEKSGASEPTPTSGVLSDRLKQLFVGAGIIIAVAGAFRFGGAYLDPDRVILADAPAPRTEMAQLPLNMPSTARTIIVPEATELAAAPPAPTLPLTPGRRTEPSFASSPPSGALVTERPLLAPPVTASLPRNDVTGSVSSRAAAPAPAAISAPPPSAPPATIAASAPVATPAPAATATPAPAPAAAAPIEPPPAETGITKGLLAAANAGSPAAAHEIAVRYAEGRGVAQNYKEAALWYERAAKGGLAPSLFRLGTMYEKGVGVTKDLKEARRLYLAAADKQNAKAMHNIAVLYAEGIDGKPDYKSASQWFRKAADYGVSDSQYNLAILYARGIGVEQDFGESYKWFSLAAASGDREAGKKRDDVAGRLDERALAAARQAIQSWAAAAQPEEATTVKTPPEGWDKSAAPAEPAKSKLRPRKQVQAFNSR